MFATQRRVHNLCLFSLPFFACLFIYVDADGLGQASASLAGGRLELLTRRMKLQQQRAAAAAAAQLDGTPAGEEGCSCRCLPYLRAYREDLGICVDDIHGELAGTATGTVHCGSSALLPWGLGAGFAFARCNN